MADQRVRPRPWEHNGNVFAKEEWRTEDPIESKVGLRHSPRKFQNHSIAKAGAKLELFKFPDDAATGPAS